MMHDRVLDPHRITMEMRNRVESLTSTADMLNVILEIIEKTVQQFRDGLASQFTLIGEYGEWHEIEMLVRLAMQQADIVEETAKAFSSQEKRVA